MISGSLKQPRPMELKAVLGGVSKKTNKKQNNNNNKKPLIVFKTTTHLNSFILLSLKTAI